MGRKNKNILGSAASLAGAGAALGPIGAAAGGILGGLLGSQEETAASRMAPAVPADVVAQLYAQSVGAQPTVGELRNNTMYDKTLAQQIAAAAASRGTNAGLAGRNVARLAAEQSQANAQAAAQQSAEERNAALGRYLQAQQMNAQVNQYNMGQENAMDAKSNLLFGKGLEGAATGLGMLAQQRDARSELNKSNISDKMDSSYKENVMDVPKYDFGDSVANAQALNSQYSLGITPQQSSSGIISPINYSTGANLSIPQYNLSDSKMKKAKKSEMTVMSDERQKELINTESLPVNNNLQMQNQNAQSAQPAPAPQAAPQSAAQPQMATAQPQTPVAPPKAAFAITGEMLQQAQQSAKGGGNVTDIQNVEGTLTRPDANISQEKLNYYASEAQRQESRGGESYRDLLNKFIAEDYASKQIQNEAYDKEQANVAQKNSIKDAQRMARLNKFYTGIATPNAKLVASQFVGPDRVAQGDLGIAESALPPQIAPVQIPSVATRPSFNGINIPQLYNISDENAKQSKKSEQSSTSQNFNPKSFLDKLAAHSYEYKESAKKSGLASDGRKLGIMAQDLEKAGPVGKSMVKQDEQGNKVVDFGTGFNAILASQAHLNERLSQIEKIYGKKKV